MISQIHVIHLVWIKKTQPGRTRAVQLRKVHHSGRGNAVSLERLQARSWHTLLDPDDRSADTRASHVLIKPFPADAGRFQNFPERSRLVFSSFTGFDLQLRGLAVPRI